VPSFSAGCPGGAASLATLPLADARIDVTVYYNLTQDIQFPYGNGTSNATANGIKWNMDAQAW
jgi:hypothetical protein